MAVYIRTATHVIRHLVVFVFVFMTNACFGLIVGRSGVMEHMAIHRQSLEQESQERANIYIKQHYANYPPVPDNQMTQRAQDALKQLLYLVSPDKNTWFFDKTAVRLEVIGAPGPYARSFPNNIIYVHRGLLEHGEPYSAENSGELLGVIGHELAHLCYGHIVWQWVDIRSRFRTEANSTVSDISRFTYPFFTYYYSSGAEYPDPETFLEEMEYDADYSAIKALNKLHYNPADYVSMLQKLKQSLIRYTTVPREQLDNIDDRITCAKATVNQTTASSLTQDQAFALCVNAPLWLGKKEGGYVRDWLQSNNGALFDKHHDGGSAVRERIIENIRKEVPPSRDDRFCSPPPFSIASSWGADTLRE